MIVKPIIKFSFVLLILFLCMNVVGQNQENADSIELPEYIYFKMHYPLIDFVNNVEGIAVYQLDTDSVGRINEIQLVRSSGSSTLDWEARRLIYEIPMEKRANNTTYKIFVNFKLEDNKIYRESEIPDGGGSEINARPQFPGGTSAILKFLHTNLNYPPEAADMGIQGRILCGFVIEKDGTVSIVEILQPLHYAFDAEVVRVVKRMPKWMPGKKDGKVVRVYYIIPVRIGLQ